MCLQHNGLLHWQNKLQSLLETPLLKFSHQIEGYMTDKIVKAERQNVFQLSRDIRDDQKKIFNTTEMRVKGNIHPLVKCNGDHINDDTEQTEVFNSSLPMAFLLLS